MTASGPKGAKYERRTAHYFTERGYPAERNLEQTRNGGNDLLLPAHLDRWLSVECKDVAQPSVGAWLDQTITAAGPDRIGLLVHHRRGNGNIAHDFATLRLDHALDLITLLDTRGGLPVALDVEWLRR